VIVRSLQRKTAERSFLREPARLARSVYADRVRTQRTQKFRGLLEPDGTSLKWTIMRVPFDPIEVWPKRNRLRVCGTINGFAFRTSLFRARDGSHILLVNKKMQKEGRVRQGGVAEVVLEPDLEERSVGTPPELEKLLRQDRGLRKFYDKLSDSYRESFADRVTQVKSPEAKRARAEHLAEMMLLAMEGEITPPPVLEAAFLRQPKARAGWRAMTPVQRRGHLLGIFYYQGPEARQKRTQKAVDEAVRIAAKKADRI
jgi:uncharacterized protein YdeI (YjbR/CyaY-like superfamily)